MPILGCHRVRKQTWEADVATKLRERMADFQRSGYSVKCSREEKQNGGRCQLQDYKQGH